MRACVCVLEYFINNKRKLYGLREYLNYLRTSKLTDYDGAVTKQFCCCCCCFCWDFFLSSN